MDKCSMVGIVSLPNLLSFLVMFWPFSRDLHYIFHTDLQNRTDMHIGDWRPDPLALPTSNTSVSPAKSVASTPWNAFAAPLKALLPILGLSTVGAKPQHPRAADLLLTMVGQHQLQASGRLSGWRGGLGRSGEWAQRPNTALLHSLPAK